MYEGIIDKINECLQQLAPQQDDYFKVLRASFNEGKYDALIEQNEIIVIKAMLARAIAEPLFEALHDLRLGNGSEAYEEMLKASTNLAKLDQDALSVNPRDMYVAYMRQIAHLRGKRSINLILRALEAANYA